MNAERLTSVSAFVKICNENVVCNLLVGEFYADDDVSFGSKLLLPLSSFDLVGVKNWTTEHRPVRVNEI